jgi:hypothetical protein
MKIPERAPWLKPVTWLLGIYAAVWISLEGALWQSLLLAAGTVLLALACLVQRKLAGQTISSTKWIVLAGSLGVAAGVGSGLLTLVFMSVKTGLHAHGPEFSPQEIRWVIRQIPLWGLAGLSAGLGLGLLALGRR